MKKIKTVIVAVIIIGLVVGFYYYLTHRTTRTVESNSEVSKVTAAISKDLSKDYPGTPREVVKYYNQVILCLYNEEYTDEEYAKLIEQLRGLMDEELLENNPQDQLTANMKADVAAFRDADKVINTSTICDSDEVELRTIEGSECAYVTSSYFVRSPKAYNRSNQEYVLRKDDKGKWRVLGFVLLEGENGNAEE